MTYPWTGRRSGPSLLCPLCLCLPLFSLPYIGPALVGPALYIWDALSLTYELKLYSPCFLTPCPWPEHRLWYSTSTPPWFDYCLSTYSLPPSLCSPPLPLAISLHHSARSAFLLYFASFLWILLPFQYLAYPGPSPCQPVLLAPQGRPWNFCPWGRRCPGL